MLFLFICGVLIGLTSFMSVLIVLRHRIDRITASWSFFSFFVGTWGSCYGLMIISKHYETALFWARLTNLAAIFIPCTFLFFVTCFLGRTKQLLKYIRVSLAYTIVIAIGALLFPETFVSKVWIPFGDFGYYTFAGTYYFLFPMLYLVVTIFGLWLLFDQQRLNGADKHDSRVLFFGFLLGFIGGGTTFMPVFGLSIYPYGILGVVIYEIIVTYTITKHRLLDISIVITRTLSWLLSGVVLLLVAGGGFWLAVHLRWVENTVWLWVSGGAVSAGVLWVWPRLAIWVQTPLEKTFLRAKVDPLGAMYDFTSALSATATLSGITMLTAKTILNHFELKYVATIQPRGQAIDIRVWGFRDNQIALLKETVFEYALCQEIFLVQIAENPPLNLEATVLLPSEISISDTLRDMLGVGPERVLHLPLNDDQSLYICLGPKLAERKLNTTELKLLEALSVQAMTALQRSLPYEEAVRNYEKQIKLMGAAQTIVTINHQLNSPLTAIKMAFDMLSKMPLDAGAGKVVQLGKEAMTRVTEMMKRLRTPGGLKETTYFGDVKMWELGEEHPQPSDSDIRNP
jgi:hypothetical protein